MKLTHLKEEPKEIGQKLNKTQLIDKDWSIFSLQPHRLTKS